VVYLQDSEVGMSEVGIAGFTYVLHFDKIHNIRIKEFVSRLKERRAYIL